MQPPLLTRDLPGTGGRIRAEVEDFIVEEIPAYPALGVGDHVYLRVEKRGMSTHDAAAKIARALAGAPREIGYAGLKDARAVTIQTFSVEHVTVADAERALEAVPGLRLLEAKLHRNKLKLGHLRGNRFHLRIRGVVPDALDRARAILAVLEGRGCPNGFGEQRFGRRADNATVGRALVRGDFAGAVDLLLSGAEDDEGGGRTETAIRRELEHGRPKERALHAVPRPLLRLLVSAYQSELFNRVLAERIDTIDRLEDGDLAYLHDRGAVFRVTDAAAEQPRADALAISPTGPMYGPKMPAPDGPPGEREAALLASEGVAPASFRVPGIVTFDGERRPLRVPLSGVEVARAGAPDEEPSLLVAFELPRGCYATVVLAELMKTAEERPA